VATIEGQTKGERVIISAWLPTSTAHDLRELARREERSVSAEIRRAVASHLALEDLRRDDRRQS